MPKVLTSQKIFPTILVIFGISGDLSTRKVLPAIYHLLKDDLLPEKIRIIGTSRSKISLNELISDLELCVLEESKVCDPLILKKFKSILELIQFDPEKTEDFIGLKIKLESIEKENKICFNRLFYLSLPPNVVPNVIKKLGLTGLNMSCIHHQGLSRILLEKPFGSDLLSAQKLIDLTSRFFQEDQIFRIDHYLAKETAQNIITFRKYNPIFNQLWDQQTIHQIKISAFESIGIENRINFYENVGALRDLIQSHLLQLLTLITFNLPKNIEDIDDLHQEKLKLLNKVSLMDTQNITKNILIGQYQSYLKEVHKEKSNTETFVRLRLKIKDKKWQRVKFILQTGKKLSLKSTKIVIYFKDKHTMNSNILTFRLQPNEGIDLKLNVKKPGLDNQVVSTTMDFSYKNSFSNDPGHPDAYERVLIDALKGDLNLFPTSQEVLRSWKIIDPIIQYWSSNPNNKQLVIYADFKKPSQIKV